MLIDGQSHPNTQNNSHLLYLFSRCLPQQFNAIAHPCHVLQGGGQNFKVAHRYYARVLELTYGDNVRALYGIAACLLYTSPSPRDRTRSRMPSSA